MVRMAMVSKIIENRCSNLFHGTYSHTIFCVISINCTKSLKLTYFIIWSFLIILIKIVKGRIL